MSTTTTSPAPTTLRHVSDLRGIPPNIVRELEFLRSFCYKLLDRINAIPPSVTTTTTTAASAPSITVISRLLTASTTISDPGGDIAAGVEIEYQLTQDSTGGRVVSWSSTFKGVDALTVGRTAGRMSVIRFRKLTSTRIVRLFAVSDIII